MHFEKIGIIQYSILTVILNIVKGQVKQTSFLYLHYLEKAINGFYLKEKNSYFEYQMKSDEN